MFLYFGTEGVYFTAFANSGVTELFFGDPSLFLGGDS